MTTKNIFPKYILKIDPEMLTKSPNRDGYFATHIIGQFDMKSVLRKQNTYLKPIYFDLVKQKIINSIF